MDHGAPTVDAVSAYLGHRTSRANSLARPSPTDSAPLPPLASPRSPDRKDRKAHGASSSSARHPQRSTRWHRTRTLPERAPRGPRTRWRADLSRPTI
eukprot:408385-Prymnesium_polylepis.2